MRILGIVAATLLAFAIGMVIAIRVLPMAVTRWHIDPHKAAKSGLPNDYLLRGFGEPPDGDAVAGVYDLPFTNLCFLLQSTALQDPRTTLLAGDCDLGFITLVQRSKLMGYPDAISIMTEMRDEDTSTVTIYSRSRYGNSDFGVNKARVLRWLEDAAPFLAEPQPTT